MVCKRKKKNHLLLISIWGIQDRIQSRTGVYDFIIIILIKTRDENF